MTTHLCRGAIAGLFFRHSQGETSLRPCPGTAMVVDISSGS